MKQEMFIRVVTEIDLDKQKISQRAYEGYIRNAIKAAMKEYLQTPPPKTYVEFDYGDAI